MPEKHVIKHSATVQITNTISLLQRKAWNILLANAYDRLPKQDFFEVDIHELIEVLQFGKTNNEYLKESLKALMQSVVEWDVINKSGDKAWKASVLLANVEITGNTLIYSYSPMLKKMLYHPETYAKISLAMQNRFSSKYALALYELCVDFFIAKFGRGETPWIEIEDYKKLLAVEKDNYYSEFKNLNRYIIKEPVKEINEKSDLFIEVEYQRQSRKVFAIKFKISPNQNNNKLLDKLKRVEEATKQAELPLEQENNHINVKNMLEEYGLTRVQIKEIMDKHDIKYILEILDFVEIKIRADKIENISAFTYKALKEDYRPKKSLKEKLLADSKKIKAEMEIKAIEHEKLKNEADKDYSTYREKMVDDYLNSLDPADRQKIMDVFVNSLSGITKEFYYKDGLKSIIIKKALIVFMGDNYLKNSLQTFDDYFEKWLNEHAG